MYSESSAFDSTAASTFAYLQFVRDGRLGVKIVRVTWQWCVVHERDGLYGGFEVSLLLIFGLLVHEHGGDMFFGRRIDL